MVSVNEKSWHGQKANRDIIEIWCLDLNLAIPVCGNNCYQAGCLLTVLGCSITTGHLHRFGRLWLELIPLQCTFARAHNAQCPLNVESPVWARAMNIAAWRGHGGQPARRRPDVPRDFIRTHTVLLHFYWKVLWSSVIALYSPYLAAYISFYPVRGQ